MSEFKRNEFYTIEEARARVPGRPAIETLWRWRQGKGCRGRLESRKFLGRLYVKKTELARFLRENNLDGTPRPNVKDRQRQDEAELARVGI